MLQPVFLDQLLQQAVADGLITNEDVVTAAAQSEKEPQPIARFGPIVDRLIARGKLDEEAVLRLQRELSAKATQPSLTPPGIGLMQTMASAAAGAVSPSAISLSGFPIPHWDRYEFLDLLGRGGMGAVYKARDRRLKRLVALKFIHGDDPGLVQRFMQEARAQARLEHPHICKVYEVGIVENKPYIAMELVTGQTLERAVVNLSLTEKLKILRDTALAVHAAHEQGIIHRDLKPSNILVEKVGSDGFRPVIMDFGLARDGGSNATRGLTESGAVLGTPAYMSPEQARGDAKWLDRRSDVYSLGATLYDVLSGKPPFDDQTVVNILLKVMNDAPRPLRDHSPELPQEVELIVSKCLNKEPEQRYPTALALAEDLERFLGTRRVLARRLGYGYRLGYWGRRNKTLAALAVGMLLSLLGLAGFGVRTRIVNLQKEARARQQTALAQKLGQSVEALEWLVRTAYLLPLHDNSYEKGIVRERMATISAELSTAEESGASLGAYVLGRGHLALHEWDKAYTQLTRAAQLGYQDVELDYALGRVLGERYSRALEDARRSGDKSFFEKRKEELKAEYLVPALAHLKKCHNQKTVTPTYVVGLIAFYEQHYDAALINAHLARRQAPWLYEAAKLEGDVFLARALEQRDHGDQDSAERSFSEAVNRYGQAAAIGHSDHQVHEAQAEAWLRWEEMDLYRDRDPRSKLEEALLAADRALEAAPKESYGYTKKAFAYYFQAEYLQQHGQVEQAKSLYQNQINNGKLGIEIHSTDPYAHDVCGMGLNRLAPLSPTSQRSHRELLTAAALHFESAIKLNQRFPWAYNDYAVNLELAASDQASRNQNPIATLDKSLTLGRQAVTIDIEYLVAYNTILSNYLYRIRWYAEHGENPDSFISEAATLGNTALNINDKFPPIRLSLGLIYYYLSLYKFSADHDIDSSAQLAITEFDAILAIDQNIPPVYGYSSWMDALWAMRQVQAKQNPESTIAHGIKAVTACYQVASKYADCQAGESQLRAAQAAWLRLQGRPFLSLLSDAHKLAQQASAQAPTNDDLLLVLTQRAFDVALAKMQARERPHLEIEEGINAATRALEVVEGWPRALAQRGALLRLREKLESDPNRRQELSRDAKAAFTAAVQGNRLLERQIAKIEAEIEGLGR